MHECWAAQEGGSPGGASTVHRPQKPQNAPPDRLVSTLDSGSTSTLATLCQFQVLNGGEGGWRREQRATWRMRDVAAVAWPSLPPAHAIFNIQLPWSGNSINPPWSPTH